MYSCKTCLFSNPLENGGVLCDKRKFECVEIIIPSDKIELTCPAHSEYPREETRYDRPNKLHRDAEDVCGVCHRDLNLLDRSTWGWFEVENKNSRKTMIKKCSICEEKGR